MSESTWLAHEQALAQALQDEDFAKLYKAAPVTQQLGLRYFPRKNWDTVLRHDSTAKLVDVPTEQEDTDEQLTKPGLISFVEAIELKREHEPFGSVYDSAKPYMREALRGIPIGKWTESLLLGTLPQPMLPLPRGADGLLSAFTMDGAVERVMYRCGVSTNETACNRLAGRGFWIPDAPQPTGLLVFEGSSGGSSHLRHVWVANQRQGTGEATKIVAFTGSFNGATRGRGGAHVLIQRSILARCRKKHHNLVVDLDPLADRLGPGPVVEVRVTH